MNEENMMNFNNNQYHAIGVAMVEELFAQAEEIYPISEEPTSQKPSLFKRLVGLVSNNNQQAQRDTLHGACDEEMNAQPSL